jgi:hypothetical protein
VKKLYVLSALLVEEHQQHLKQQVQGSAGEIIQVLTRVVRSVMTEVPSERSQNIIQLHGGN